MILRALWRANSVKSRILIFGLLGPAMSCVVLAILSEGFGDAAFVVVPVVLVVELAPFLICALIDFLFEEVRWWERLVVAAIAGFVTTFVAALMIGNITQDIRTLQIGLIGAIPAVVCSWLAQVTRSGARVT